MALRRTQSNNSMAEQGEPLPANPVLGVVDGVISGLIYGVGVNAAIASLTAQFPFLGLPIIKQLVAYLFTLVAGKIFDAIEPGAIFSVIDNQTDAEKAAVNQAKQQLSAALHGGDDASINKAKQDFKSAFGRLIRFDGV